MILTNVEAEVLQHTLGRDNRISAYRNYFTAGKGHDDYSTLEKLVRRGLMGQVNNHLDEVGESFLYYANIRGKKALKIFIEAE